MAYFSNSSEGYVLDDLCLKCHHGFDAQMEPLPCAVLLLQLNWNYEQLKKESYPDGEFTPEAKVKKEALDILIPNTDEALCNMFIERRR